MLLSLNEEAEWSDSDAIKRRLTRTTRANSALRQQAEAGEASVAAEGPRLTRAQAKAAAETKQSEKTVTGQAAKDNIGKEKKAAGNVRKRKSEQQSKPSRKSGEAATGLASQK